MKKKTKKGKKKENSTNTVTYSKLYTAPNLSELKLFILSFFLFFNEAGKLFLDIGRICNWYFKFRAIKLDPAKFPLHFHINFYVYFENMLISSLYTL